MNSRLFNLGNQVEKLRKQIDGHEGSDNQDIRDVLDLINLIRMELMVVTSDKKIEEKGGEINLEKLNDIRLLDAKLEYIKRQIDDLHQMFHDYGIGNEPKDGCMADFDEKDEKKTRYFSTEMTDSEYNAFGFHEGIEFKPMQAPTMDALDDNESYLLFKDPKP